MPGSPARLLPSLALLAVACGPLHHAAVRPELLDPETGRGSAPLRKAAGDRLRVAVYGDAQGNRPVHRAVVAAVLRERPDLVLFAGDAVDCLPAGHLPDLGGWQYAVPLWPQVIRGYPAALIASLFPFPAVIHETLLGPFFPPRDRGGFNGFLEDTAPLRQSGIPMLFAPGNHDQYHLADREAVARYFGSGDLPGRSPERLWHAVDLAGWRFVVLDTGTDLLGNPDPMPRGGPQLAWLEEQLSGAERDGLRVVVMLHLPPFSSGQEEGPAPWVRERVVEEVLDRHPVALVLSGHVHAYERIQRPGHGGRPVTYLVSGGAGGRFFHAVENREPGSAIFVEETRHFVLLELGPEGIAGEMIPVEVPDVGAAPVGADRFNLDLR